MTHSGAGRLGAGTLLPGHFRDREVGHRDHPVPGPGGVSVTIEDLARYAQACLHPPRTPLGAAITAAQAPQVRIGPSREQALAWVVIDGNRRGHGGGTTGFTSCLLLALGRGGPVLWRPWPAAMAATWPRCAARRFGPGDPPRRLARARPARGRRVGFTRRARSRCSRPGEAPRRDNRGHYAASAPSTCCSPSSRMRKARRQARSPRSA